jgi:hypothetical protein
VLAAQLVEHIAGTGGHSNVTPISLGTRRHTRPLAR